MLNSNTVAERLKEPHRVLRETSEKISGILASCPYLPCYHQQYPAVTISFISEGDFGGITLQCLDGVWASVPSLGCSIGDGEGAVMYAKVLEWLGSE